MRRVVTWCCVIGIVLGTGVSEVTAGGFATTSQSATSTAMGGVGVANPDEPNASFYNPAWMTERDGFRAYAGTTLIIPRTVYRPPTGASVTTEPSLFAPPNLHAAYSFTDRLSVGLGATFPYGLGIEWPNEWVGRENIQAQQLQTLDINPNVAYEFPDLGLSVAAGAQVAFSSIELRRRVILRNDTEIQSHLGGTGQGVGATAAVAYEPNDWLTLGLNYRSAIEVNYDGVAHFEGEEGTPFGERFVDGDVSTSITLPHSFSVGFGWDLDRVFLELDFSYTTWSTYDRVVIDFAKDRPAETNTLRSDWRDATAIKFGADYNVVSDLQLRFGLQYDMTPIPDETVNASLPGNDRAIASFGAGYTFWRGIRVDAGYQLVSTFPREIDNDRAPDGVYQTTAHLIGLNVGYGFD